MTSKSSNWKILAGVGEHVLDLALKNAGVVADRVLETNLRLGVTGLRRAGKTVFVTSMIDNLIRGGRLPFMDVVTSNRFLAARLRSSPHRHVPRFSYEKYLASLTATPPHWPAATNDVSQLRVTIRYTPTSSLRRSVQPIATLNLDVFDYPGEWLMDLPMLNQSYEDWSELTLSLAEQSPRRQLAARWLHWLETVKATQPSDESIAREGAALYTEYLLACRRSQANLSLVQPGRFIEPGELADSPLLTFCPLPVATGAPSEDSLAGLMTERFEGYKNNVVRKFFIDHFARLDRQIVLVDVLGMLNAGPAALHDMRMALTACLEAFRHGRSGWLSRLTGGQIDRVLFAATKADHVAASQHANLRNLLDMLVSEARNAIRFEGAMVETMAIAAVKCTETVTTEHQGRKLACVQGTPLGRQRPTVLFPGVIPDGPDLFPPDDVPHPYRFLDFEPPSGVGRDGRGLPNIRLDQALNYLLGDYLA